MNDVIQGDCLDVLKTLEANSVDALVCDPPAGISFMGKAWDNFSGKEHKSREVEKAERTSEKKWMEGRGTLPYSFSPSAGHTRGEREAFIGFMTEVMTEALRVLKPGAHGLVWALPRTSHWTALALEDAGFEIRDKVFHLFGSGFPKSLDVSKAIDRMAGKEREVIGKKEDYLKYNVTLTSGNTYEMSGNRMSREQVGVITAPATPEAQQYAGWGSALKPACEEWILVRKPLAEKSIAAQVLATGTGAINIDASRVGATKDYGRSAARSDGYVNKGEYFSGDNGGIQSGNTLNDYAHPSGRFPSHLLLSHSLLCVPLGEKRVRVNDKAHDRHNGARIDRAVYGDYNANVTTGYADDEGCEVVEAWQCAEQCPVVRQQTYFDEGGASRYFQTFPPFIYAPKASRRERNAGCEALPEQATRVVNNQNCKVCIECGKHLPNSYTTCMCGGSLAIEEVSNPPRTNHHPTVKSQQLMQYLCKMITPPNGVVLDCFAGSGSTGVACVQSGFRYILIEKEQEYIDIIHARLAHAHKAMPVQEAGEYECVPECPVRLLGEMSGVSKSNVRPPTGKDDRGIPGFVMRRKDTTQRGHDDTGTAARFFKTFPPDSLFADMDEEAQG